MSIILIVDDEPENRNAMKRALEDDNPDWKVITADGLVSGVEVIKNQANANEPVDVVLTDLVMETEKDGLRMLSNALASDPNMMAILFTAKEKSLDRYEAFSFGAFDVIEKNIRGKNAVKEIIIKTRSALRYRQWSQRINFLSRYFDPRIFEKIDKTPSILDLKERTVTICFWDIRGFSKLCESLKAHPRLISGFLKDYCEIAANIIFEHNGILDKFIGDGVMALFGVLSDADDRGHSDAIDAVNAAIAFKDKFEDLLVKWNSEWRLYTPEKITIGLGCGIHTGNTLVGNVGSYNRDQFTALGPDVNFASRIEARSESGQIYISQSTAQRIEKVIRIKSAGEISDIKNIPGTFPLFQIDN